MVKGIEVIAVHAILNPPLPDLKLTNPLTITKYTAMISEQFVITELVISYYLVGSTASMSHLRVK
jgi:hypothetical protein